MDRASLSAAESAELQHWLAGDRRRRGAFLRARAVWLRSESAHALGPQYDPAVFRQEVADVQDAPDHRRPRWTNWSGLFAASVVLAIVLLATLQAPAAYATAKGEMRTVPLGEGTSVTLNTDTRIEIYDDDGQRRIRLVRGEVLIEGTGAAASTLVEVDGRKLEAAAATFIVRKLGDQPAQVLVQDGRVTLAEETSAAVIPLQANTSASLLRGKRQEKLWQLSALSLGQLGRELAWREGKIALQGETLAEAVAIYARYGDTRIVIADPGLAQLPVTGLFAINNPLGFSRAVAEVFGGVVRQEDNRIVISRPL